MLKYFKKRSHAPMLKLDENGQPIIDQSSLLVVTEETDVDTRFASYSHATESTKPLTSASFIFIYLLYLLLFIYYIYLLIYYIYYLFIIIF